MLRYFVLLAFALAVAIPARAEQIAGQACYHYSDNESLNIARDIALALAKRDALEGYVVFMQSSSTVENLSLKNDLIASLTAGYLHNMKIVGQSESAAKREVCRKIVADVEPMEVKDQVTAQINAYRRTQEKQPTGLPESKELQVVKVHSVNCGNTPLTINKCRSVRIYAVCKRVTPELLFLVGPRMTWYDKDGIPEKSLNDDVDLERELDESHYGPAPYIGRWRKTCRRSGDVLTYQFPHPPPRYTFKIDFPEDGSDSNQ